MALIRLCIRSLVSTFQLQPIHPTYNRVLRNQYHVSQQHLQTYTGYLILVALFSLWLLGCTTTTTFRRTPPEVSVSDTGVRVQFPGHPHVEAVLAIENGEVIGLSRVLIDGQEVLALSQDNMSPPMIKQITGGEITPVTDIDVYLAERARIGNHYTFPKRGELQTTNTPLRGRLSGWKLQGRDVIVNIALPSGRAEWRLAPESIRTHSGVYTGVSWQLRLYDVGRVYEVEVEEPVVFAEGDWRFQQRGSQSDNKDEEEFRLSLTPDPKQPYSMSKRKYNARQQPFFFLAGTRGSTLSFFDHLSCAEVGEAQKGDRILLRSAIPVRPDKVGCIATPRKSWLFRRTEVSDKWSAINEWTWAWDHVIGDLQAQIGLKPTDPLPTLLHQEFDTLGLEYGLTPALRKSMDPPILENSWLYHFANEIIPKAAEWGIGAIELRAVLDVDIDHTKAECPEGSFASESVCSPWGLRISPKLGGEAGLAYLMQKAHARDIKVAIWSAPAHQSVCSPVVRAHPEWLMFDADGRVINRSYITLVGMDLTTGFKDYIEDAYRRLHKQTGLDGVWADSYCAFGADRDMSNAAPYPQLDEVVLLQRAMQRMGYTFLMKEDCGPFGLSTRSSGLAGILGREYLRYYFLYNHSDPSKRLDPDSYFRTLASKGVMDIRVPREFEALPTDVRERIVRTNFAYREVLPLMKRRYVLGSGDTWQGVAWADRKGRPCVLFSFEAFDWSVPKKAQIRELITGNTFSAPEGVVHTQPWRVYRLE